jgi:ABC-2 type transport system ATP-binding protein
LATGDDVRLDGVGKRYGVRLPWVVRDVNLEIGPGALVRLEGRNGAGKSTLLRVIAGVSAPSKGSVAGRPETGYVPERFPPALPFSARDFLSHVGRVHGMTSGELAERIQYCLDRLGGWEFADVPLRNMSKGMCQKVAVAQALLPSSGLLVLDEAWTGLDVEAKGALDEVVGQRLADGGSVVFVDHDPQRLAQLDAQRWRIEDGQARPVGADGAEAAPVPAAAASGVVEPAEADPDPWPAQGAAAEAAAILIEVAGYPDGGPDPGGLPGVLSAQADGELWLIRATPQDSGAVLRALLAVGDAVHVLEVRKPEDRP